ncbi:MAG: hypothetical protein ACK6DF_15590 [Betaproteobacteria bacterium]
MLKPQDVCVLLKIVAIGPEPWSYQRLAIDLGMSASEVHAGVRRSAEVGLLRLDEGWGIPVPGALDELLVHGVRYVWPAAPGPVTTGIATGPWAPGLEDAPEGDGLPWVWPDAQGGVRGQAVEPLYKSMPAAAQRDGRLHLLLAFVDGIRAGNHDQRVWAVGALRACLGTSRAAPTRGNAATLNRGHDGKKGQRVHG